jgi:hypothetical protein
VTDLEAGGSWANELLMSMDGRTGPLGSDRTWETVKEWTSFSARFILLQAGGERIALKLGTNWEGGTVAYVAEEVERVSHVMANLPSGRVAMPGVLGVAANPPAMALEYFEGTPLFEAIPRLESPDRLAVLRTCGEAIGAFHRAEQVPDDEGERSAAMIELLAAARRSLVSRSSVARVAPGLARGRSYRFSPNDFLLNDNQDLVLLDPPHVQKYDYVHRDIGSFFMELHRSLVGERRSVGTKETEMVRLSRAAFIDGYRETGPAPLDRSDDIWAIDLFQAARVVGVARSRASSRAFGRAWRALSWAWWLRRGLSLEGEG